MSDVSGAEVNSIIWVLESYPALLTENQVKIIGLRKERLNQPTTDQRKADEYFGDGRVIPL
jgi:hypothetical protein